MSQEGSQKDNIDSTLVLRLAGPLIYQGLRRARVPEPKHTMSEVDKSE